MQLGFNWLPAIGSALVGGSGGGSGGGGSSAPITVSPDITTTVSPQISPVFVQTGAGSTGSFAAGTSMGIRPPYADAGTLPLDPYGGVPEGAPQMPAPDTMTAMRGYLPWVGVAAVGLIIIAAMSKKRGASVITDGRA
jgi:hypothetical protein